MKANPRKFNRLGHEMLLGSTSKVPVHPRAEHDGLSKAPLGSELAKSETLLYHPTIRAMQVSQTVSA